MLQNLADELLLCITDFLTAHDLCNLTLTCKKLNKVIEPLLWEQIELHSREFHDATEIYAPAPFIAPSTVRYHVLENVHHNTSLVKAERFFTTLQLLYDKDIGRLRKLAGRVKRLCSPVSPAWKPRDRESYEEIPHTIQVLEMLQFFNNLEALELYGDPPCDQGDLISLPELCLPTPVLVFVKLFGYIPLEAVRWILRAGPTIERLELGLLDRPVSSHECSEPDFPLLPEYNVAEEGDEWSDYGSLTSSCVIPRPLADFLPISMSESTEEMNLPCLKHLHLCHASQSKRTIEDPEYSWSTRAESAFLSTWKRLLQAGQSTIQTLILEQRPGADFIEERHQSETDFMREDTEGEGNKALIQMVESVILSEKLYPSLRRVCLYGMVAGEDDQGFPSKTVPAGQFLHRLQAKGVNAECRLGHWCQFEGSSGVTDWTQYRGSHDTDCARYGENEQQSSIYTPNTLLASI